MILGKIMMIQNSSPIQSVDYLISKKIMSVKSNITYYTLEEFIEEVGISRASMVRYMKEIGIHRFSRFKSIMYDECMQTYYELKSKQTSNIDHVFTENVKTLAYALQKANRVLILGDGNKYSLLHYQKRLSFLGIDIEIPVYLGNEEEIIESYHLTSKDLVLFISLCESYESFLENRSIFYLEGDYLEINTVAQIGFIGLESVRKQNGINFEINVKKDSFDNVLAQMIHCFEEAKLFLTQNTEF